MLNPAEREPELLRYEDGLPVPRRYWAVLSIWLAVTLAVLDGAIANVALPTIARELNATAAASIWIVNAYQLAITVALLPLAALGDIVGYRRIYQAGLAVFTLASLGCVLSETLTSLALARIVQGLGAAGIMSVNAALMRHIYPQRQLGRGLARNAVVLSVASAIGPSIAAAILSVASWQWLFAINLPMGILAFAIASRALPHSVRSEHGFDWRSAVLSALAFGCIISGSEMIARDWRGAGPAMLILGLAAGVLLLRRQRGRAAPLVPVDLLRIPIFGLSIVTSIVSFAAQMLAFVTLPFHFQQILGRSVVETGLLMTPWPIAVGIVAPFAGRLADRYPAGLLGGIGLGLFAAGLLSLFLLPPDPSTADIVWRMALCGMGFGFFQPPNNRAMVSAAPRTRSGAAGGMLATARLLGQTAGATSVAILFHTAADSATRIALALAVVIAVIASFVSLLRLRRDVHPARPAPEDVVDMS